MVSHDNEDEFTTDVLYTLLNRTLCTEVPLSNRISTVLSAYTKENRMEELDHIRINEFLAPESVDFKHSHYVQINGLYHVVVNSGLKALLQKPGNSRMAVTPCQCRGRD